MTRYQARLEADKRKGQKQADEWNERHPIGTPVVAYPVTRDDEGLTTVTRSRAWTLGHGAAVVSVDGYGGGICLTHVDPYTDDSPHPRQFTSMQVLAHDVETAIAPLTGDAKAGAEMVLRYIRTLAAEATVPTAEDAS